MGRTELRIGNFSYGEAPYDIHLEVKRVGGDILAVVTGGTRLHIGAVALAEPANALHPVTGEPIVREPRQDEPGEGSGSGMGSGTGVEPGAPYVSILVSYGHKDAVLAEMFARGLCEKYNVNVCATAGVHVDDAGKEEIVRMLENAKALLALATSDSV